MQRLQQTCRPCLLALFLAGLFMGGAKTFGQDTTDTEALFSKHQAEINQVEETLTQALARIRTHYLKHLETLEARARRDHMRTLWLWIHRQKTCIDELGEDWINVFTDPLVPPDPLQSLNTRTLQEVTLAREKARTAQEQERARVLNELDQLKRQLTQTNQIEAAIAVQELEQGFAEKPAPHSLDPRLKTLELVGQKHAGPFRPPHVEEKNVPADASYPFTRENPAFKSLLDHIHVVSAGHRDGPRAQITLGRLIQHTGTRGLSLVAILDQEVLIKETYDTYADSGESARFVEVIRKLPYGTFVAIAVRDDATRRFSGTAQSALFRLGAEKGILGLPYRSSYLLIGAKGLAPGHGIELTGPGRIEFPNPEPAE